MKYRIHFIVLQLLCVLLLSRTVQGVPQREYSIEVQADGSAKWTIEHRFSMGEDEIPFRQLSDPTYFSDSFVAEVKSIVSKAAQATGRNMTVKSFVMTSSVLGNYSHVRYEFEWSDFAQIEDSKIVVGDVFRNRGPFFYGEGTVSLRYPSEYIPRVVSPRPHVESNQTLTWYGIEDFSAGEPYALLSERSANGSPNPIAENAFIVGGAITLAAIGTVGLYYLGFQRKKIRKSVASNVAAPIVPKVEDDEEKVISLIKAAGGSLYQSTISDQCEFSRAKTSKLLATMVSKGKIRRVEKGREKIVTLIDERKETKR